MFHRQRRQVREDGRMVHDMYIVPGKEAFRNLKRHGIYYTHKGTVKGEDCVPVISAIRLRHAPKNSPWKTGSFPVCVTTIRPV
jgi:hypothetical protein